MCTDSAGRDPRLGFACDPSRWWGGSEGQSLQISCLEGRTQLPAASGASRLQERKEFSCQDLRTVRNLVPWLCMRSEQLVGMPPADNLFLTARLRASPRSDRLQRSRSLPGDQRTFRPVRLHTLLFVFVRGESGTGQPDRSAKGASFVPLNFLWDVRPTMMPC